MSTQSDHPAPFPQISQDRLAALTPEERRRIGMAMRFLVDVKALHLEGLAIGSDMLEGKTPAEEIGMRLLDFERNLRLAANDMLKHPLRVVHADALRTGETKLDDSAWLMRTRIKGSEARRAREDAAREARFQASTAPSSQVAVAEEPEPDAGPRP